VETATTAFQRLYSNLTVEKCDISDSQYGRGVYCSSTIADIQRCTIQRNGSYGLLIDGSGSIVNAALNIISDNGYPGVYISGSGSNRLMSNLIYRNGWYGIQINSPAEIRNNTIVYNGTGTNGYGIYGSGDPNISSNIIWNNDTNSLSGTFTKVNYNCIENNYPGTGNIAQNPQFQNAGNNDYHLKDISPCIDKGDPNFTDVNGVDIDGQDRVMDGNSDGNLRVDMGADEFCPFDLSQDGFIDFLDFAVFAKSWRKSAGDANYNYRCDFSHNNKIDYNDLEILCDHWLWPSDWDGFGGEGAYFADNSSSGEGEGESMMQQPEQEADEMTMELPEDEQQSMMEGEEQTPAIYLACDTNTPDPNDEVTVWVHSDAPLFAMGIGIYVIGDANITTAMCEADCSEYGWDNGWNSDPYIEDNWVYLNGVRWDADANGTVGYIKFRYNGGEVSVYIDQENSIAFGWDGQSCPYVPLSQEALTFEADPNES